MSEFPQPQGLRVWLNYTDVVFVSGGWVGEQKLRRVVDKPAHPPLARQRGKRIIKCATVKHEKVSGKNKRRNRFEKQIAINEVIKDSHTSAETNR